MRRGDLPSFFLEGGGGGLKIFRKLWRVSGNYGILNYRLSYSLNLICFIRSKRENLSIKALDRSFYRSIGTINDKFRPIRALVASQLFYIYIYIYIYINITRGKKRDVTTFPDKPVS